MNEFHSRRHRITIEQNVGFQDSYGELHERWEKVCESWAEIKDDVITIRYQPYLLPGMRAVIGSEHFQIEGVIDRPGKTRLVELRVKKIRASADMPDALHQ